MDLPKTIGKLFFLLAVTLVLTSCSREANWDEARPLLDNFLKNPRSGPQFEEFYKAWKSHAGRNHLLEELQQRTGEDHPPVYKAKLLLTRALCFAQKEEYGEMQDTLSELTSHPGFRQMLSDEVKAGRPEFVSNLIFRISDAFIEEIEDPEQSPFATNGEGYKMLSAIASTPAALWILYTELDDRDWVRDNQAEIFLKWITFSKYGRDPERLNDFLQNSPILAPLDEFDPVDLTEKEHHFTLLEAIIANVRFGLPPRSWDQLILLLNEGSPDSLAVDIISAYRLEADKIPDTVAAEFEKRMAEIRKLEPPQQARIADLAVRLTVESGLTKKENYSSLIELFRDFGISAAEKDLAEPWLSAETWAELPATEYDHVVKRITELIPLTMKQDPERAVQLLIHVSRLHREQEDPVTYANRVRSIGEKILYNHLFAERSIDSLAYSMNTFHHGSSELGIHSKDKFDEWHDYLLYHSMFRKRGSKPDVILAALFDTLKEYSERLDFDDRRILIGSALDTFNRFPKFKITGQKFIEKANELVENEPAEWKKILPVYIDAAKLAKKSKPKHYDEIESPYFDAISDSAKTWQWRYALAATYLANLNYKASDKFMAKAIEIAIEGCRDSHRFDEEHESVVTVCLDLISDPELRDSLQKQYLVAWKERYLNETYSNHRYNVLGRTLIYALRNGEPETAREILRKFTRLESHPAGFISAILGGDFAMAHELQKEHIDKLSYHPRQLIPGEDYQKQADQYLEFLDTMIGDHEGLSVHTRAQFVSLDGIPRNEKWKQECKAIAEEISSAYAISSEPQPAYNRALYLMSGITPTPVELKPALEIWFENYDGVGLFENGTRYTDIELRPVQRHIIWSIEDRNATALEEIAAMFEKVSTLRRIKLSSKYRDLFLDAVFSKTRSACNNDLMRSKSNPPELHDTWTKLFRAFATMPRSNWTERKRGSEFSYWYATTILSGKPDRISDWWNQLDDTHRKFVLFLTSEKRNIFKEAAPILNRPKWVKDSPDLRKEMATALLAAPGIRDGLPFSEHFQKCKLARKEELLEWNLEEESQ